MQSKVVEGLEKALASPQHPLTPQVKAEILEQTLFHSYTDKRTYAAKARVLISRIKQNPDLKSQILEGKIDVTDKIALGLEKGADLPNYVIQIKKLQATQAVLDAPLNMPLKLFLVSRDDALHRAWQTHFGDLPDNEVQFHLGDILELRCDAVVSPANCFGYMDGGIDKAYMNYFGTSIQTAVQDSISSYHDGIMKIGNAEIVCTGKPEIPFLIATPTMLTPDPLPSNTINPYLASRALFSLWRFGKFRKDSADNGTPIHSKVLSITIPGMGTRIGCVLLLQVHTKVLSIAIPGMGTGIGCVPAATVLSIAIPGMGTGIGCVPAATSAHQVRIAYDEIINGRFL